MMGMTPDSSPILSSFNNDDTLIMDECSMMDINLLTAAVKHAGNRGRVIFIGDANQLESIDTGAIMNDMILCRHMTVAELTEVQRQAAKSDIVTGSYKVLAGEMPDFEGPGGDLHYIEADSDAEIIRQIKHLVEVVIPQQYGFASKDIQILATMKKGEAGVTNLNDKLKHSFNEKAASADTPSRALGNQIYHVGDRVMQTLNRYDLDIQNGEVGEIIEFDERKCKVVLDMGDRIVRLPYSNYPFMTHSWGKTVHKSQGSEYEVVIISAPSEHQYMLHRKSLFTAMTRGKSHVWIVGPKPTLELTIKNGKMSNGVKIENAGNNNRMTHLPFLLAEAISAKSHHKPLQAMAENSRNAPPPKPVYMIDTDSIAVPF
jgi:exodeoxyribonuclease V alpha subunit